MRTICIVPLLCLIFAGLSVTQHVGDVTKEGRVIDLSDQVYDESLEVSQSTPPHPTTTEHDIIFGVTELLRSLMALVQKMWKEGREASKELIILFKNTMQSTSMKSFLNSLPSAWKSAIENVVANINGVIDAETMLQSKTFHASVKFRYSVNILEQIKDEVETLQIIAKLQELAQKMKTHAGVVRDLVAQKITSIVQSEVIQNKLKNIPEQFGDIVQQIIDQAKTVAKTATTQLVFQEATQTITLLRAQIQSVSDELKILLDEILDLLQKETSDARELGRTKMMGIFSSAGFQRIQQRLPSSLQDKIKNLIVKLQ